MFSGDHFLHTATHNRTPKKPSGTKSETRPKGAADVKRAFDGFTSKWRSRNQPHAEDEMSQPVSSLSLLSNLIHAPRRPSSGKALDEAESVHAVVPEEPHTPEEQVSKTFDSYGSLASVADSTPSLTPDALFQGLATPSSQPRTRRAPLLRSYFSQESISSSIGPYSVVDPLESLSYIHDGKEACGLCDMALDSEYVSEPHIRMKCGHRGHLRCCEALIEVAKRYDDDPPTCAVCDGPVGEIDPESDEYKTELYLRSKGLNLHLETTAAPVSGPGTSLFGGVSAPKKPLSPPANKHMMGSPPFGDSRGTQPAPSLAQIMSPELQTINKGPVRTSLSHRASSTPSSSVKSTELEPPFLSNGDSKGLKDRPHSVSSDKSSSSSERAHRYSIGETPVMRDVYAEVLNSSEFHDCQEVETATPLRISTYISNPKTNKDGSRVSQVSLFLHVPNLQDSQDLPENKARSILYNYRITAKDVKHGIFTKKDLDDLRFDNKPLSSTDLGSLRLHSQVRITSPEKTQLDWPQVDCYLFEKQLVFLTDSNTRVRAVLDVTQAVASAEADPYEPSMLCVKYTTTQFPEMHFHTESPAVVAMWKVALKHPTLEFPLSPKLYNSFIEDLEMAMELNDGKLPNKEIERAAVNTVLCLSNSLAKSALRIQQLARHAMVNLRENDKLALLVYGNNSVLKQVDFEPTSWGGWNSLRGCGDELGNLSKNKERNSPSTSMMPSPAPISSFDAALEAAENLINNRRDRNAQASVILISDDDTKLASIPALFSEHAVPIHTIGLTEYLSALTLSTISRTTDGFFGFASDLTELSALLPEVITRETQNAVSDVVVRIKPRFEVDLMNFRQFSLDARTKPVPIGSDKRVYEWKTSKMNRGDVKYLMFEVKGAIIDDKPLLQISTEHKRTQGGYLGDHMSSVRISAPPPSGNKAAHRTKSNLRNLLVIESALRLTFENMEEVITGLISEDNRRVFSLMTASLRKSKAYHLKEKKQKAKVSKAYKVLQALEVYFSQQCDRLIDHKDDSRVLMLEYLQKLWQLDTRQSFATRDVLDALLK